MCGIVAIFNEKNCEKLAKECLERILHRGKDAKKVIAEKNFAVAHCLHHLCGKKVIQPLSGKGIFAADCEIYNWKELCKKFDISARNDAELLFFLLEKAKSWNERLKSLEHLRGVYAFVYFRDGKILIARDLIGIKPLAFIKHKNKIAIASEKKALKSLEKRWKNCYVEFLHPRHALILNVRNGKIKDFKREFIKIEEKNKNFENVVNKLDELINTSIKLRIPEFKKVGILFSGGLDSSILAYYSLKNDAKVECFVSGVDIGKKAIDIERAERVAEELGVKLNVIEISLDDLEKEMGKVAKIIESPNVMKNSVALPMYLCAKKAYEKNFKILFSGSGSDEIFAGYRRAKEGDINRECFSQLIKMYERDLYRDDLATIHSTVELRLPFLDIELVKFAFSFPGKFKIKDNIEKYVLRKVAEKHKLSSAFEKKKAAQYGSNFLKAIKLIVKRKGFNFPADFYEKIVGKDLRTAVLFSGGKDSCLALHELIKQKYDIKCLLAVISKNPYSYMYHPVEESLIKKQAKMLGIPLLIKRSKGEKEKELKDLEFLVKKAKKEFCIEAIGCGAIFSNYQRNRVEEIAEKIGVRVFAPLWHREQKAIIKQLLKEKFEVIISRISSYGLTEKDLGRKIDHGLYQKFLVLEKKFGFNVAGEGGEYETAVLNMPEFKKVIKIKYKKIMENENCGTLKIR